MKLERLIVKLALEKDFLEHELVRAGVTSVEDLFLAQYMYVRVLTKDKMVYEGVGGVLDFYRLYNNLLRSRYERLGVDELK